MSRRVGARFFLDTSRKRRQLREALVRLKERGGTLRLGQVLDALDVDSVGLRNDLSELETAGFEVVVRRAGGRPDPALDPGTPAPGGGSR